MFDIINQKNNKHWWYLSPALIILVIFTFFPLTKTFIISLSRDYNKFNDHFTATFNFENYRNVFKDPEFLISLRNTLILVFFTVPISLFISLIIALTLNSIQNRFFKDFLKTFFFLPLLSNIVIMGMVFSIIFYYNYEMENYPQGVFNSFLSSVFHIKPQQWITNTAPYEHKMFVLIIYNIWTRLPFKIFVFVLALQDINKSYYEAAKIDGASRFRIFFKITLPLLIPIIFYQFIIEMLAIFKEYESIIGIFANNINYEIRTIVGYIYAQTSNFSYNSYSKGATAAMILFFISVLFTVLSFYFSKKKINY
ncbi:carbohydrate ABC transporter permease [Candidatus Phytoplasma phoenicium]|uniref:Glycerol-3-phosphate ABC transporter, permease 1 n=1 Tax=Candidatus Phytoplasma phoenicium TaxID=198422 RepID=A0A0L0MJU7_9MOLU|nr:sugar ABC transporter permease [Candidatus Phytoplasma phoenicium]KND62551.1 Glycerol-3-phosphate ABC transporter, permease 1 [Candidatus Phytoplasma phoenicium]